MLIVNYATQQFQVIDHYQCEEHYDCRVYKVSPFRELHTCEDNFTVVKEKK